MISAHPAATNLDRNPGVPLQTDWFEAVAVNTSAAERRATTLTTRRTVKKEWQAAWLVNAIRCIDLTTLAGDDTENRVARLCAKARRPIAGHILQGLGLDNLQTGAVCVYPTLFRRRSRRWWGRAFRWRLSPRVFRPG